LNNQAFELLKAMLDDLGDGLKEVKAELNTQSDILLRNTISLEEHMKRSDSLEKYVQTVEIQLKNVQAQLQKVDAHVSRVEGVMGYFRFTPKKFWVLITAISTLLAFFIKYKEFIIKVLNNLF
jgi:chromosome segregation ATPase